MKSLPCMYILSILSLVFGLPYLFSSPPPPSFRTRVLPQFLVGGRYHYCVFCICAQLFQMECSNLGGGLGEQVGRKLTSHMDMLYWRHSLGIQTGCLSSICGSYCLPTLYHLEPLLWETLLISRFLSNVAPRIKYSIANNGWPARRTLAGCMIPRHYSTCYWCPTHVPWALQF